MAVLQISKIQVRRGKESDTPVPSLSAGEFAWSVDVQKLYIGNGSVSEGAPQVGNTEIVTFTNDSINKLFSKIPFYTYGTQITTANKISNSPLGIRPIFAKLDDVVSSADYGTQGDYDLNTHIGSDDTLSLQDAITKTFLASDSSIPSSRKKLRIPAGTYQVTGTIFIPPYTTIEGDGMDKTIIVLNKSGGGVPIFQFAGIKPNPSGQGLLDKILLGNNIQGSGNEPRNVSISGLTITYATQNSQAGVDGAAPIQADCAIDSEIKNVKSKGAKLTSIADGGLSAIDIRGNDTTSADNLKITNCHFENIYAGITSRYNIKNIKIQNNKFYNLGFGILFNDTQGNPGNFPPGRKGPQFVDVSHNSFELTYYQAISVADPNSESIQSYIFSEDNNFVNCGNGTGTQLDKAQQSAVITFDSVNNSSVNDYFSRFFKNNDTVDAPSTLLPCIDGLASIQNNIPLTLTAIQSPVAQPILTLAKTTGLNQTVNINYVAQQVGVTRRGSIKVVTDDVIPVVSEEYSYNGTNDGGFSFTANYTTATNALAISIVNPQAATQMVYQFNQLY